MKWWIKESDSNWVTLKCLIKSLEISLLIWKNLIKSCFSFFYCICTNHLTECCNSVFLEEHMLCTAKTDTLSTKLSSLLSICRSICISSNLKLSILVSPSHNLTELTSDLCILSWDETSVNVTSRTID